MSDPIARVVADADVLATDLLVGGTARDAIDLVRSHSWMQLVASEPLLADAAAVIAMLADDGLAADWRSRIDDLVTTVDHPADDHPAIASAYHGDARHVITLDEGLTTAQAATAIRREAAVETSVKHPDAFVRLFDPGTIYEAIYDDPYPGPDRGPRG